MSRPVFETINDLRWGRASWRVLLLLSVPALSAGFLIGLTG